VLILLLAGANLTIIQFVALREFASLVGSNEIVVLLVAAGYFLGLSVGYHGSDRLSSRALLGLGAATLALHATLPFSARWLVGALVAAGLGGTVPPLILLLAFAGLTPFYAVFLPRLIAAAEPAPESLLPPLVRLYATELAGGALGLLLVVAVSPARQGLLLTLHLAGLVALLLLFLPRRPAAAWLLLLLPPVYLAAWPALNRASLASFYRQAFGLRDPVVLASELSPYQRVDLLQVQTGRGPSPYLYLNGNLLYGTRSLHQHNLLVSILPRLVQETGRAGAPLHTLVVAGGSLDSARYLAPRPGRLQVVEIDEAVTRLARLHLQEPRGGFPTGWDLAIDDGKHFLANWTGAPFDVIAVDIPVPTHLQTALLHSDRFFALARARLAPGGIFSISLAGRLGERPTGDPDAHLAHRITAGLLANFRHVAVVHADTSDFAWASDAPLEERIVGAQARMIDFLDEEAGRRTTFGAPVLEFLDDATLRRRVGSHRPIGEADLQIVLRLSLGKLRHRFYPEP
jgi:predicted membrane-bound spermidine synthase